ncbi:class I SAM-dependent methyltransferase [Methylobacterium sp. WL30]|uniref:class I SAM-dependent methyltransferase n=1 Tax=unclassified Methylobacterium TaxID=2615210 RepID=UPI0011CB45DE|nr:MULTISPECIES: class I SAM-dependent methyltransferase [unclassified Methylobacterium]TXN40725.1 class I SAM-dependent methyltransferase [Methylobacterium sp. WL93]TXN49087.1 class I SAM-dependent methyltransferase [Methylobacterium sp. WL119]TXN64970.1 class I SAM-dependent methyltransferase [Methylobacterium sp. WL30]
MNRPCCRACGATLDHSVADLGLSPLSNSYVPMAKAREGERVFPLHAFVCDQCWLVQLEAFETPENIFSDYAYFSGFSTSWLAHAERYVVTMTARFALGAESKVVEVASNDGYLLQYFVHGGVPVLGVEPAANVAAVARGRGVPSEVAFFGAETARRLVAEGHTADLTVANNVLAHVPDILDFVAGFKIILKSTGAGTFEFPHLLQMIEEKQFDTIYHEHFSYLSLGVVSGILERSGLRVFDVEELPTHGGSLRVFFCHQNGPHVAMPAVERVIAAERAAGLFALPGYARFAKDIVTIKCDSLEFLIAQCRAGKTVCGYGAAAKGNTFLNYCGVGRELVPAVADRSPHKQGTLLPGSRIPVVSPEAMLAMRPDYVLILPWNIKEEVFEQLAGIREWGGQFVTCIPALEIH